MNALNRADTVPTRHGEWDHRRLHRQRGLYAQPRGLPLPVVPNRAARQNDAEPVALELAEEERGLGRPLFGEVARAATQAWHKGYASRSKVPHKALSPLHAIHQKLAGLTFNRESDYLTTRGTDSHVGRLQTATARFRFAVPRLEIGLEKQKGPHGEYP